MSTEWGFEADTCLDADFEADTCLDADFCCQMHEFQEQLRSYIADDKKHEFVELLRSQLDAFRKSAYDDEVQLLNYILLECNYCSALNCAAALLNGDTGLTVDLNEPQLFLLHGAAIALSPKMTKFFLKSGLRANAKFSFPSKELDGLQPIDFAVNSIRRRVLWTTGESLYLLIVALTTEGMREPTETMRLLINELSESEVSEVICRYAVKAEVIELAILLIMASERSILVDNLCMPCSSVHGRDKMTLRQYVVNQIVLLENKVRKLVETEGMELAKYRETKKLMMTMLMLLEIFMRTGDKIAKVARDCKNLSFATRACITHLFQSLGLGLIIEGTSCRKKLLSSSQQGSGQACPEINLDFQSGIPQFGSLETMPDFGWDESDLKYQKLLPLHIALEKLSCVVRDEHWTPNESIFKLIIILCLPKMKELMEEARSLAKKSKMIGEIACYHAKECKLIELAIILMVAGEKVLNPIKLQIKGDKTKRSMTFQQFINSELAQTIDLEYRLFGRMTKEEKELSNLCEQRKLAMISALMLLEVSQKAGSDLRGYIWSERKNVQKEKVVKDVSKLLSKAGFKLKPEDTDISNTIDSSIKAAIEGRDEALQDVNKKSGFLKDLNEIGEMPAKSGSQTQDVRRLSYVLPCGFVETNAASGRPSEMGKFLFTRYPRECKSLPSGAQSFRAFWTSRGRRSYSTSFPEGVQQGDVRGVHQLVQRFPATKQFAAFALVFKKGFKYL